jgi:NAD(P)-dependent dehydrogenase (short-subunit alcohol dehydrogenase family)
MRLKDKVAIVTGGGQGIGHGIALMFAHEGAKVTIAQRTAEKLEQTTKEIEEIGGEVLAIPTDVGKEEEVKRMIDATQERFGGLDVLVNNAGIGLRVPVDEVKIDDYERLMDTNLKGMYMGCHYGVPLMKGKGGSIINISSVHGVNGCPLNTVYAATKGGIIGCTRALAAELAPDFIRVNVISPGAIRINDPLEWVLKKVKKEHHEEFLRLYGEQIGDGVRYFQPLEIIGMPDDIAYCAVYLAADESRFVTGQNIVVDGGLTTYLSGFASENARKKVDATYEEIKDWVEAHQVDEELED